jgi:threonyl-tRNA synthetase
MDMDQAKQEFIVRFQLSKDILEGLGLTSEDYELAIRFTKAFYDEHKNFVLTLVQEINKPVLIEMWDDRFFYFTLKWEFNFIDNLEKASALSTDQIDIENAERYGITYIDEKGNKRHPLILHCSPSGAIERCVYAILEKAYMEQQHGNRSLLPLWLSPTQLRIVPVSDRFLEEAKKILHQFSKNGIRTDLDDRPITMQKKIREAEKEWINFVVVIGQKELASKLFSVRDRRSGKIQKMKLQELINRIQEEIQGKPFRQLGLPALLSERPQFAF